MKMPIGIKGMKKFNFTKKKVVIFAVVGILAVSGISAGSWYYFVGRNSGTESSTDGVYVDSVGILSGLESAAGAINRYAAVVEPQETIKVEKDGEKTVKEVFVEVGDKVEEGSELFSYDTETASEDLEQAKLDLERSKNSIDSTKAEIAAAEKERANAAEADKFDITVRIQELQATVKESEYDVKSKEADITDLEKSIEDSTVKSEKAGIIKSIATGDDTTGEEGSAYITILADGDYRIKGTVNEQNMASISEGVPVIVHSRVDEEVTWEGTITSIDMENPETASSSDMYYSESSDSSSETASSNYPFYITVNGGEDLMLGQHVYVELDLGQSDKEGIWISSEYVFKDGDKSYVWAESKKGKIEKREVTVGETDEEMLLTQIKKGLAVEDYIAWPDGTIKEGDNAIENTMDSSTEGSDAEMTGEDTMIEGGDSSTYVEDSSTFVDTSEGGVIE